MAKTSRKSITIQEVYTDLATDERREAEHSLKNYVNLVKRIYDRLRAEGNLEKELLRHQYDKRCSKKS